MTPDPFDGMLEHPAMNPLAGGHIDGPYIREQIPAAHDAYQAMASKVLTPLYHTVQGAEDAAKMLEMQSVGGIESKLDQAEAELVKRYEKVMRPTIDKMNSAYNLSQSFGFNYPEMEQVQYELETGQIEAPNYSPAGGINPSTYDGTGATSSQPGTATDGSVGGGISNYYGCQPLTSPPTYPPEPGYVWAKKTQPGQCDEWVTLPANKFPVGSTTITEHVGGGVYATYEFFAASYPAPAMPVPMQQQQGQVYPPTEITPELLAGINPNYCHFEPGSWTVYHLAPNYPPSIMPFPDYQWSTIPDNQIGVNAPQFPRYIRIRDYTSPCPTNVTQPPPPPPPPPEPITTVTQPPPPIDGTITDIVRDIFDTVDKLTVDLGDPKICEKLPEKLVAWKLKNKDTISEYDNPTVADIGVDAVSFVSGMLGFESVPRVNFLSVWAQSQEYVAKALYYGIDGIVPCDIATMVPGLANLSTAKWLSSKFGGAIDFLTLPLEYALRYQCQTFLPTQPTLDELWLQGRMTADDWECLTKLNGNIVHWHEKMRNAGETVPTLADVITLERRGKLTDVESLIWKQRNKIKDDRVYEAIKESSRILPNASELIDAFFRGVIDRDQFIAKMKELGYDDEFDASLILKTREVIPPYTDLLRMMVRDSADNEVAAKFQYDKDFEKKFTGKVAEWAKAQGIDATVFKYIWRAHWDLPSFTQLSEMYHRLRIGRVAPELVIDLEDIKYALEINDMSPEWVGRLLEISRPPLTRIDTQRAYFIGSIDESQLYESYRDLGYDHENASTLVTFTKTLKAKQRRALLGIPSAAALQGMYARFEISLESLQYWLRQHKLSDAEIDTVIAAADTRRIAIRRRNAIRETRKRFLSGQINAQQAIELLAAVEITGTDRIELMESWYQKAKTAKASKQPTAAMICNARGAKLITYEEQIQMLTSIGYNAATAIWLAKECDIKMAKKIAAEEKARAKEEKAAREEYEKTLAEASANGESLDRNGELV